MKKTWRALSFIILIICSALLVISCAEDTTPPNVQVEKLSKPRRIDYENGVLTWEPVKNADSYIVYCEGNEYSTNICQFELSLGEEPGDYLIKIQAVSSGINYVDSDWAFFTYTIPESTPDQPPQKDPSQPVEIGYDENGFLYRLLDDGSGYELDRGKNNFLTWNVEELILPDFYCGLPVKSIRLLAFAVESPYVADIAHDHPDQEEYCNTATKRIKLPAHLESIGAWAFCCTINLEEIIIPDSVTEIGIGAFSSCTNLKKIVLPKNLKVIPYDCFKLCSVTELYFPDNLESIGIGAFTTKVSGIPSTEPQISDLVFPDTLKSIGGGAFLGWKNLKNVTIPDGLETLGPNAFYETAYLDSFPDGVVNIDGLIVTYKGEMPENTSLILPENTRKFADNAFHDQKNLVSVYIPDGAVLNASSIFFGCSSLSYVRLPADLTSIPEYTFTSCTSLTNIELPKTLTSIGDSAFSLCSGLENLVFPEGLKTIGSNAFRNCNLQKLVIPSSVTSIGQGAFSSCQALEAVVLSSNLERLEDSVFMKCTNLKEIILPGSLTYLSGRICQQSGVERIFYEGTEDKFYTIIVQKGSTPAFDGFTVYFYSEEKPTESGNYWRYVDGKPTIWE